MIQKQSQESNSNEVSFYDYFAECKIAVKGANEYSRVCSVVRSVGQSFLSIALHLQKIRSALQY